jgi:hypothetical protein
MWSTDLKAPRHVVFSTPNHFNVVFSTSYFITLIGYNKFLNHLFRLITYDIFEQLVPLTYMWMV